ncbi:uncharacterized protein LOC6568138 [Drosophila grimshawi]|uniref:GH15067 n=1 Tax=Drosophila grimshawi TaxID=7222 RepID=B4JUT5_DROGR|nr:uncharacterized protein LOC6568138 [Drosophila grimshawi]XP_032596477.1 uncharacterized protein LOC6568138 [Drosophila grimshawi]EDV91255.1 GH15067 [Drosophila grimshawi]
MLRNKKFYKHALEAQRIKQQEPLPPNYIDNLHEIFFEQIFERIDYISDQVRMARAYPQFLPQILKMWQKRWHYRIVGPNTPFLGLLDIEDYVFFMEHMADRFTELHVHEDGVGSFAEFYDYITHLCDINIMRFNNVECCVLGGNPNTMVDEDIRDLTVMLPNLKRLTSCMNLSGLFMRGFRKLEQLVFKSMYHSVPLDSRWMQEICLSMTQLRVLDITDSFDSCVRLHDIKLPNLQVLKINLSSVECIVSQVLQLPKLRKLAVRFDDSRQLHADQETIFQQIIVAKSECITRIALNNEVVQLPPRWQHSLLLELPKLRALVCENWYHDDFFLDNRHMPCEQMQVLSFSGWEVVREFQLLELVSECPQLTQLALNTYHSTVDKLVKLHSIRSLERNAKPLQVYSDIMWTHLSPNEYQHWRSNKYVQVTCDGSDYDYQEDGFEFDFV